MVYMAGDNSLDGAALKDLAEMARAGFTNAVNVLVQLDRLKDHKTRRFRITKGGGYNKDCIETFGETDTGDPRVLCDFIKWGVKRYPAGDDLIFLTVPFLCQQAPGAVLYFTMFEIMPASFTISLALSPSVIISRIPTAFPTLPSSVHISFVN